VTVDCVRRLLASRRTAREVQRIHADGEVKMSIVNDRSLEAFYEYDLVVRIFTLAALFIYFKIERGTLGPKLC
jgi:hypothetical protein